MRLFLVLAILSQGAFAKDIYDHDIAKDQYTILASENKPVTIYAFNKKAWEKSEASRTAAVDQDGHGVRIYQIDMVSNNSIRCERIYIWMAWERSKFQINKAEKTETYRCMDQ